MSSKNNEKSFEVSHEKVSAVDTFINKLNESRFKEDSESIIDILKDIQSSIKS